MFTATNADVSEVSQPLGSNTPHNEPWVKVGSTEVSVREKKAMSRKHEHSSPRRRVSAHSMGPSVEGRSTDDLHPNTHNFHGISLGREGPGELYVGRRSCTPEQ